MNYSKIIGVIGSSSISGELYDECVKIGQGIAKMGIPVINGGKTGVMEAVGKGVFNEKGINIGILPVSIDEKNEYVNIPIVTGIGIARNVIIVNSSDLIIVVNGKYGTLSEIAFALQLNKPIISYKSEFADKFNIKKAENIDDIFEFIKHHI